MKTSQKYFSSGASDRDKKKELRNEVAALFANISGSPRLMTFPGDNWVTENQIIEYRKQLGYSPAKFDCIEFDAEVYKRSVLNMPDAENIKVVMTSKVKTDSITFSYEDFNTYCIPLDISAAWIDFIGPISSRRIEKLTFLWEHISTYLVVTSQRGRYSSQIHNNIQCSGSIGRYLRNLLPGSYIQNEYDYGSECAMSHVIFSR